MNLTLPKPSQKETLIAFFLFFSLFLQFSALKAQETEILYRVNNGGPEIEADPINWSADQSATNVQGTAVIGIPSKYLTLTDPTNEDRTSGIEEFTGSNETPYPDAIFATGRFSSSRNRQTQTWDFPVSIEGTYTVNILLAEVWEQAQEEGKRIFNVTIEGEVLDTIDMVAEVGWDTAFVKSYEVMVTDGNIDINLNRNVQNPATRGIEIIGPAGANMNLPPRFTSIPLIRGEATQTVTGTFATIEDDGDPVALEVSIQHQNGNTVDPAAYSFTDNGDGTARLVWATQDTDISSYVGTITASDKDGATSSEFTILIIERVQLDDILYRINAGGGELADITSPERLPFSADTTGNRSPFGTGGFLYSTMDPITVNATVPGYVPLQLFQTERYERVPDGDDLTWSFPVAEETFVNVRFFLSENFLTSGVVNNNNRVGPREFDIIINEDTVEKAIDVFKEVGQNVGIMRSYNLVSSGSIDISFGPISENPSVKGIEILEIDPLEVTITSQDAVCFGDYGSVAIEVSGGVGPYEMIWENGISADQLLAGTYTVTIKDGSGQQQVEEVTITQPEELTLTIETSNATAGASDGSATATVTGGVEPYTFDWGEGVDPDALAAGNYSLMVTDANGCVVSDSFLIGDPSTVVINVETTNPLCYGETGSAEVTISGGTEPYDIAWSDEADPTALPAGEYTVTVTDANDIQVEKTVTITQPESELMIETEIIDASEFGANDGSISLHVTGGTAPHNIFWGDIDNPNALAAGTYTVSVKDAIGCEKEIEFTIGQPAELTAEITTTPATCDTGGTATVNISGGTEPYEVSWSNNADPDNLAEGTYEVTIVDSYGNSITEEVEITVDCDDPVATDDLAAENSQLKLYPVPGDQYLNVSVPTSMADKEGTIRVYTAFGQKLLEQKANTFILNSINVSHLSKGTYIIEVTTKDTVFKSRFLIGK